MNSVPLRRTSPWLTVGLAALAWVVLYRSILPFWNWVVYELLGLEAQTRLGEAVHFFLYDTSKILLLLIAIIFAVAVLRSFFSVERTRALLGGKRTGLGNLLAAGLGVVTPFCSCSAVPAFIGFVSAGVPLGITLTFLIASPMVNEVALVLLYTLFGWKIAALYLVSGLALAVVAGLVLGRMGLERYVEPFVYQTRVGHPGFDPSRGMGWNERFAVGMEEVKNILGKIWPYLLLGIGLGAVIHGWVPAELFARYAEANNPLAVPVAVLLGIPLYSNAAGVLPLVEVLHQKGIPMGTLLSFMMAVVALSLPEMILLRQVLKLRLIMIWILVVGLGIVLTGYLFNAVL